jgi:hypothetical protein
MKCGKTQTRFKTLISLRLIKMKVQAARMELSFHHPRAMAGRAVSGLGSLLNTEGEEGVQSRQVD